ncbi:MAG: hypothetical protein KAV87_18385 [Desulfobacteraceae bacterium]|nr:hypothetical protein [Desulfobacteraceae bacterium]
MESVTEDGRQQVKARPKLVDGVASGPFQVCDVIHGNTYCTWAKVIVHGQRLAKDTLDPFQGDF